MLDRIRKMGFWVSDFCFCWFEQGKMNKNAIFVEIRGALGMSQYPHFSPTGVVQINEKYIKITIIYIHIAQTSIWIYSVALHIVKVKLC